MRKSLPSAAVFPFLFAAAFSGVPAAFAAFDAAPTLLSQEDAEQSRKRAAKEDWSEVFADGLFKADGEEVPVSALRKKKYVGVYVSAFQADEAVGQRVSLRLGDVLLHQFHKVGHGHYGPADYEVVLARFVLAPYLLGLAVFKTDGLSHLFHDENFLTRAVDKLEA